MNALDVINRTFDARIRSADISEEERAQLAQEQATAFNMYDSFLNDPALRQLSQAEQKERYDDLIASALAPAAAREIFGISLGTGAAGSYQNFQTASQDIAKALAPELAQEWTEDFREEFAAEPFAADLDTRGGFTASIGTDDGDRTLEFVHGATEVRFTQQQKLLGGFKWVVKFPGDDEWVNWNNSARDKMEELR